MDGLSYCCRCFGTGNDPDYKGVGDCRECGGSGKSTGSAESGKAMWARRCEDMYSKEYSRQLSEALGGICDALDSIERKGLLVARNLSAEELADMVTVKQRERN